MPYLIFLFSTAFIAWSCCVAGKRSDEQAVRQWEEVSGHNQAEAIQKKKAG